MMEEILLPHPLYPNYLVGNKGTVICIKRNYRDRSGKLYTRDIYNVLTLSPCGFKGGKKPHYRVSITANGVEKRIFIHKLVLETHVSLKPHSRSIVNHIDGDPSNNDVSNLEWCDDMYNAIHALKNGFRPNNYLKSVERSKLRIKVYDKITKEVLGIYSSQTEAAKHLNISLSVVSCASRGLKGSNKYIFERV